MKGLVAKALKIYEDALDGKLVAKQATAQMKAASEVLKRAGVMDDKAPTETAVKIRFTTPLVKDGNNS